MWDLLEVSIPAVVLLPLVAVGAVLWMCLQQNARSSDVRRTEFQRLQRLAMDEHERAERELEREYMRHKQGGDLHGLAEPHQPHQSHPSSHRGGGDDFRRRGPQPNNGYGGNKDFGHEEWRELEVDVRMAKQVAAEEEQQRRKQAEAALQRRKQADAEEFQRKQEEMADRKRRENLEGEMRRRQAEEQEWQRRRADLEAQAKRDAEQEEKQRRLAAEQEEKQRRWNHEEALKQEPAHTPPRNVHPMSSLNCVVCHRPTKVKRRCSRCKSMNYCSRECQVQHWSDGHKFECRPHDPGASPRGSIDGDSRNYSDFSPRS